MGRKRLEAVFQTVKAFFFLSDYRETGGGTGYIRTSETDVLVCETSLSVLSGREFSPCKNDLAGYSPCGNDECRACKRHPLFLNECDIYKLIMNRVRHLLILSNR